MKTARQQTIVQLLTRYDTLTTAALSAQLGVSIGNHPPGSECAANSGKIVRRHGRARMLHSPQQESSEPFRNRLKSHYADKADIARHALNWIDEGMTLALDASSTCFHLARQLPDIDLTVFTNSVPVCGDRPSAKHHTGLFGRAAGSRRALLC